MLKIGISGVAGKMGKRILGLAVKDAGIKILAAFEKKEYPEVGQDIGCVVQGARPIVIITSDFENNCKGIDCIIEFTLPEPTLEHLTICERNKIPMVIGTTGFDADGEKRIKKAARSIPIVFSPNMAVGVNLFFNIVRQSARILNQGFDIKIDETHHVHKKDSPSGTAKMIAKIVSEVTGRDVPIKAFREGEVIGNHGIVFDGLYETLEIRHNAKSRDVFAAGALDAARFIAGKAPGLYNMQDVLGF